MEQVMARKLAKQFVLWGQHPAHCDCDWIKLSGGNQRQCNQDMRTRQNEGGWVSLAIYAEGDHPDDWRKLQGDIAEHNAEVNRKRLEYLRGKLRAERISYGELAELQSLAEFIDPSDTELLEAAGAPEVTPNT
jgi:hypothetical protein